ncbi:hypothetical protein FB451DRAFT_1569194 [Mycena latifolia]|nr:hypothetical protein FB451DRAFT_1569194 [Mycena latifolia]
MPPAKPLTERDATDRDFDENGLSVWALLLGAETWADVQTSHSKYKDALVGIRILGHFLCDFWKNRQNLSIGGLNPYRQLIWQINSCDAQPMVTASPQENGAGYQRLSDLGLWYRNHLMRVFRSNTGPVPVASDHPSRPSLDAVREGIVADIKKADKTKKNVKQSALARDGFRCVVTGAYDDKTVTQCPKDFPASAPTSRTQCAHIFSESAQDGDKAAILKMFNFDIESLLGGQVNTLRNVLTMTTNMHGSFDELEFWLEEVIGQPNTESLSPSTQSLPPSVPPMVSHPRSSPVQLVLAIRAAVSRVAHMSGAAEQYEMVMRDRESTTVMSGDAASAEMLSVLLQVNA